MFDLRKYKKAVIFSVCALLLLAGGFFAWKKLEKSVFYPKEYSEFVERYCNEFSVNEHLVYAVINTESAFDQNAQSDVGARGLMQIMPDTFKWLQTKLKNEGGKLPADELYNPETNIKYGVFFLSILMEAFEDERIAVTAYHAGMGQTEKWLGDASVSPDGKSIENIPSRHTGHYVDKVMSRKAKYDKLYG
ncbi:MAG: lytic transglycosylase domain-containing protein [Oscillospiraceae bacterium]|jgi:soluble lytic murein transglycosylase|nr:lytic transglycosylase domain-containing protein [Oscillospiraceae bacterium]